MGSARRSTHRWLHPAGSTAVFRRPDDADRCVLVVAVGQGQRVLSATNFATRNRVARLGGPGEEQLLARFLVAKLAAELRPCARRAWLAETPGRTSGGEH